MIDGVFPIVFTDANTHREIAGMKNVTSAGFVSLHLSNDKTSIEANAYGESISLGLKSNHDDSAILTRMFSRY